MAQPTTVPTKKWYESKIVLLALTIVLVAGTNLAFGWLTPKVTPEQLAAIQAAYPQVADIITRLQNGESIFSLLSAIVGILIGLFRVWGTTKLIPQSVTKTA
jgi:hypothetical protein